MGVQSISTAICQLAYMQAQEGYLFYILQLHLYDCTLVACGVIFIRPVVVVKLMSQGFKLKHTPARRVMIAIVCSFLPHKIGCKLLLLKLVADVYMLLASFFFFFFRFLECHYFPQSGINAYQGTSDL